jgi:hypothetical protein
MKDKPDAPRRFHMHETSRTLALEGLPLALSVGIQGEGCGFERAVASSEQKPLLLRDTLVVLTPSSDSPCFFRGLLRWLVYGSLPQVQLIVRSVSVSSSRV